MQETKESGLNVWTTLAKDIKQAANLLKPDEVRFLVDYYYIAQEDRKRGRNQERALGENGEPHGIISWLADLSYRTEKTLKSVLGYWAASRKAGAWAQSITGIGPVISAGLLAHINIEKAPTVGHIWRFAGLDPTRRWEKGTKRPWNARLKTLCAFKLGECFVKVSNNPNDIYGKIYASRKVLEQARNDAGEFAAQAAAKLAAVKIGKDTDAYKAYSTGKLPPAHIHARARRYAVKLFLSHFHEALWREKYGNAARPIKPYIFTEKAKASGLGDHTHYIEMPDPDGIFSG